MKSFTFLISALFSSIARYPCQRNISSAEKWQCPHFPGAGGSTPGHPVITPLQIGNPFQCRRSCIKTVLHTIQDMCWQHKAMREEAQRIQRRQASQLTMFPLKHSELRVFVQPRLNIIATSSKKNNSHTEGEFLV